MSEQPQIFRSGDRVRVTGSGIFFEGSILAVRPDGLLLCLLDGADQAVPVDASQCTVELLSRTMMSIAELL